MAKVILVTGSNGLIGSEVVAYFAERGWRVHGVDNNMRASFFGPAGDTRWNQQRLVNCHPDFVHHELDLRDRRGVEDLVSSIKPERSCTVRLSRAMILQRFGHLMTSM